MPNYNKSMIAKIVFLLVLVVLFFFLPWWALLLGMLFAMIFFRWYVPMVLVGLLYDLVYGSYLNSFGNYRMVYYSLALVLIVTMLRKQLFIRHATL